MHHGIFMGFQSYLSLICRFERYRCAYAGIDSLLFLAFNYFYCDKLCNFKTQYQLQLTHTFMCQIMHESNFVNDCFARNFEEQLSYKKPLTTNMEETSLDGRHSAAYLLISKFTIH